MKLTRLDQEISIPGQVSTITVCDILIALLPNIDTSNKIEAQTAMSLLEKIRNETEIEITPPENSILQKIWSMPTKAFIKATVNEDLVCP